MKKIAAFLCLSLLLSSQPLFAVGSANIENASFSAASIAQGNAVVAQGDEPAAISYNPAGLTQLKGIQTQYNSSFINVFTQHSGLNSDRTKSDSSLAYIPTAYMSMNPGHHFNDRLVLGIGSDSPFGLANKYDSSSPPVHYTGWVNAIKMFTVKPVAAMKITDWLSMGTGPIYYRLFDFTGIQAYPNIAAAGAGFPGSILTDGQVRVKMSGNRWGWQYGLLLNPHPKNSFGFYFRSPVTLNLRGRAEVENSATGNFQTGANAKLNLPMNMTWAYAFKPNERTVIEVDFGYTRWSTLKRFYINADPVNARENFILAAIGKADKDYEDSFSIHLGGKRKMNDKLTLSAGSFFYTASIPQDSWIPAIPDANRLAFTLGAGYEIFKNMTCDFAYLAQLALRRKINNGLSESLGTSVDGRYFSYIQGIYLTMSYKWENAFGDKKIEKKEEIRPAKPIITTKQPIERNRQRSQAMERELADKGK